MRVLLSALFAVAISIPSAAQEARGVAGAAWKRAVGARAIAAPSVQAGSAVLACDDGTLKAISVSGSALWVWDAGGKLLSGARRSPEGTSYVVTARGRLVAVNRSGRELWHRDLGAAASASLAVGWDGRIFVSTQASISCFSVAGFPLWKLPLTSSPIQPPAVDAVGGVTLALSGGELVRAGPFGKHSSVALPRPPVAAAPLFPAGDRADRGTADEAAVSFADGEVVAYSRQGTPRRLASLRAGAVALGSGTGILAFAFGGGDIGLLDTSDGNILWTGTVPRPDGGYFHIDARGAYFLSRRGSAGFAFDGRRLWNMTIDGAAAPPALSDEGLLLSGGEDWILYAYRVEDRVRADSAPLFGAPAVGDYGLGERALLGPGRAVWSEAGAVRRLDEIGRAVAAGWIGGAERDFTRDLMSIAGSARPAGPAPRPADGAVQPHLRESAVILLSRFASGETVPFLVDLFERDEDSSVRAAAAEAIGEIGLDPKGIALRAFARTVFPAAAIRDERLLYSVALSVGALCRASGPPLSDAGVPLLVSLAGDDRPPPVRDRARLELKTLAR